MPTYSLTTFATRLDQQFPEKNWTRSRLRALRALLRRQPAPHPAEVLSELGRIERRGHWRSRGGRPASDKYAPVLADLERFCQGVFTNLQPQATAARNFHAGTEVEIPSIGICLLGPSAQLRHIEYDDLVAQTTATTQSGIPFAKLVVELGSNPFRNAARMANEAGILEYVSGPFRVEPNDPLQNGARRSLQALVAAPFGMSINRGVSLAPNLIVYPLADLLARYNASVLDPRFRLDEVPAPNGQWYVGAFAQAVGASMTMNVQLNIEVPLRKVADFRAMSTLFSEEPEGRNARKIFEVATRRASERSDEIGETESSQAKLAGILALYIFDQAIAMAESLSSRDLSRHGFKNLYDLLCKTPVNDCIRLALSPTCRANLARHVLQQRSFHTWLTESILAATRAGFESLMAPDVNTTTYHPVLSPMHEACFVPGQGRRYDYENARQYGSAVAIAYRDASAYSTQPLAYQPLATPVTKYIPVQIYYTESAAGIEMEPAVVFETRNEQSVSFLYSANNVVALSASRTIMDANDLANSGYDST